MRRAVRPLPKPPLYAGRLSAFRNRPPVQGGCPPLPKPPLCAGGLPAPSETAPYAQTFAKVAGGLRSPPSVIPASLSVTPAPLSVTPASPSVIPAQAGIQAISWLQVVLSAPTASRSDIRGPLGVRNANERRRFAWIPACAGMTESMGARDETFAKVCTQGLSAPSGTAPQRTTPVPPTATAQSSDPARCAPNT